MASPPKKWIGSTGAVCSFERVILVFNATVAEKQSVRSKVRFTAAPTASRGVDRQVADGITSQHRWMVKDCKEQVD